VALFFPAPHSFTGEDVLELQGHGGMVVMRLLALKPKKYTFLTQYLHISYIQKHTQNAGFCMGRHAPKPP
jgi:hypothetical protein